MKNRIAPIVFSGLLVLLTSTAGAQVVGYPPTSSPYRDLEYTQEWTLLVGQYHAHQDEAQVGPQSGTLLGAHYEWRAGGPAHLIGEITRMSSDRRLIDPFKAGAARELGTVSRPLYAADAGLGLTMTGGKSWHHLVPEIDGGAGIISDLRTQPDSGGFRFGTRFAITYGAGLRFVPGGRWQLRADIKDRLYSMGYPEAYYTVPAGGGSPVVPTSQSKSFWMNNPAFTLGISRLY
ncbi:MAG TPA: hypothetical protein VGM67_17165 [Gemmatimonadaceae bacterium]